MCYNTVQNKRDNNGCLSNRYIGRRMIMINELTGWSDMRSLKLSRLLVYLLMVMLFLMLGFAYFVASWYESLSDASGLIGGDITIPTTVMLYICDFFGLGAVFSLNKLLANISKDEVFTEENAKCLRKISWCCVFAGIVMLVYTLWVYYWGIAAFCAFFMGLIMRVLKNVFVKAVEIKSENDYTI